MAAGRAGEQVRGDRRPDACTRTRTCYAPCLWTPALVAGQESPLLFVTATAEQRSVASANTVAQHTQGKRQAGTKGYHHLRSRSPLPRRTWRWHVAPACGWMDNHDSQSDGGGRGACGARQHRDANLQERRGRVRRHGQGHDERDRGARLPCAPAVKRHAEKFVVQKVSQTSTNTNRLPRTKRIAFRGMANLKDGEMMEGEVKTL